jgi:hypothetical protein
VCKSELVGQKEIAAMSLVAMALIQFLAQLHQLAAVAVAVPTMLV